ncbi:uncharacterized protein LOC118807624 [Colossoma macropomum]|uniref:uncharacterized protein LOC118807624 n=1 Tax=Colossoma macropomum TaxID=42526 RepID=UPI001863B02A|nr:uncharacterized protein LOC118807624 [Colossoma macropomum]
MTTRLLESFSALDSYSKRVLERHAKKNCQLSMPRHCFAHDKGNTVLLLHYDLDFLSPRTSVYKPKSNTEHAGEEQGHLPKRLRISKSSAPVTSMKGTSSIRSVEVISSKINIRPFTSNENTAWTSPANVKSSGGNIMRQDKEEERTGFMITSLKKPQSLRPYRRSPHRMKWSREVENVPSLYALNKDSSKALVGSSLGHTDTSHWCSSSFNDVDGPFKLPESDGILVTQELHQEIDAELGTSRPHKNRTGEKSEREFTQEQLSPFEEEVLDEPVPLSFEDELERKNVKVLTPCPASVYKALPIVSETYPVVYRPHQQHHEPFSSPGFHCLDPAEPLTQDTAVRKSKVHSTIIHITESLQADYMIRSLRERQCSRSYSKSGLKATRMGAYHVNLRMLSADGNVVKSPDLSRLPLHNHKDMSLSVSTNKSPLIPLVMPRRKGLSSTCVGPVVNGKNPNQTYNTEGIPSTCSKLLCGTSMRRFSSRCYTSAPQTQQSKASNPKNKMDFLLISKPVTYSPNGMKGIITKHETYKEDWSKEATVLCEDFLSQGAGCETFVTHEMSFSTPTSGVDCSFQDTTTPVKEAGVTDHAGIEDNSKLSYILHLPQPINIPTAESFN